MWKFKIFLPDQMIFLPDMSDGHTQFCLDWDKGSIMW